MDPTDLYFVSSILSEVVVATKEVNEKTRDVAYDLLVAMGHKMKAGGIISSERVCDMEGAPSETQATISEYFTMVTAGLVGTTPHMVSAAITSLSRPLFEFHKDLDPAMVSEMISMMHLFVNSSNRDIVKSALGFIKVTTIRLDIEIVRPHLQENVGGIIRWSHEHKGHFKVKVRHILERLVQHRENQERRAAYQQANESANSRRRSYGLHANHSTLTQSSSSVPSSSMTAMTMTQLSTGSIGASSGTSPLSLHSSQSSGRQTMTFAKQQPLKKSPSELVATAYAHASAIAANRERNPIH
ncbi:MAG: hypothetical protein J3Q66DRAFT_185644 [Benniella sp.]|nr:MAG: hypothetical protein J3Q66DRAFT_185644 [Benniella sp.]